MGDEIKNVLAHCLANIETAANSEDARNWAIALGIVADKIALLEKGEAA